MERPEIIQNVQLTLEEYAELVKESSHRWLKCWEIWLLMRYHVEHELDSNAPPQPSFAPALYIYSRANHSSAHEEAFFKQKGQFLRKFRQEPLLSVRYASVFFSPPSSDAKMDLAIKTYAPVPEDSILPADLRLQQWLPQSGPPSPRRSRYHSPRVYLPLAGWR